MSEETKIEEAIKQFFQAMDTQNYELMEKLVAHDADMIHIGTNSDEIWKGWDELKDATIEQFAELKYYKAQVYELKVKISHSGNAAWYSHLLDAKIKSNGKEQIWKGARFTGGFEKEMVVG